ncbi:MAG TPA: FtsX-like permease family protein [Ktedonobacteraceae bacterium]|jgi:ABC-type lipoprotein release transport system permease subunit
MARSAQKPPRRGSRIAAILTLAWWQLRLTWRLLCVAGSGIIAAVILVCTVPLYSQVALSAGLRDALHTPENAAITIHSVAHLISQSATQHVTLQIQQELQQNLGPFLAGSQFSVQSPALQANSTSQLQLIGWSLSAGDARQHLKSLVAGRLPETQGSTLEVAITSETAQALNLEVGSNITVPLPFLTSQDTRVLYQLPLRIVGIFEAGSASDTYWHGLSFTSQTQDEHNVLYPALVSNTGYLSLLDRISQIVSTGDGRVGVSFETPSNLYWYYNLAIDRLDSNRLDDLNNGLSNLLIGITNQPVAEPFVDKTVSTGPASVISGYLDRIAVARIPLLSLAYLIAGLLLFFVSLMTDLLVERQAEAIALLRSRGASREQIFTSLLTQSIGIGILALLAGPFLSLAGAHALVLLSLPGGDQGALNVILADPLSSVSGLWLAALGTVVVSILAMVIALKRAARLDVLALRKERARTAQGAAWLRMGLDMLAGIVSLTGYGLAAYITSPGVLDARTRVLLLPPMTLLGAVFLLLGCMLLFLRIFPLLLEALAHLAMQARGVTSLLALAQMARTLRQSLRMTLLLALAIAAGIFSLVFSASQARRIPLVASYQVGADFSGVYPGASSLRQQPLAQQEAAFAAVPGVLSASVGYTSSTRGAQGGADVSIELRAVDATTFAHTTSWDTRPARQSPGVLLEHLLDLRPQASGQHVVPAIVDAAAWQSLSLTPGSSFTLSDFNGSVTFIAIAQVGHIPTISDSTAASGTSDYVARGGVLVDFATYQATVEAITRTSLLPSTVWLSTQHDPGSLNNVRAALSSGALRLNDLADVQAQGNALARDPLSLALLGVLAIGTITALLLGLFGNLTVSWFSVRSRLLNFAVMRALGTTPRQLAGILTCEQVLVYASAIGLGVTFGLLLSFLVLPAFIFTSPTGNASGATGLLYITQSVPPVQMVVPVVSIAMALGLLSAICVLALSTMVRIVSRPGTGDTLRLNND